MEGSKERTEENISTVSTCELPPPKINYKDIIWSKNQPKPVESSFLFGPQLMITIDMGAIWEPLMGAHLVLVRRALLPPTC